MAKTHKARTDKGALAGWCSWYQVTNNIKGGDVLGVVDAAKANPAQLRPKVVQIDDGYQDIDGEWNANSKFPEGMAYYAKRIAETGARSGLWMALTIIGAKSPWVQDPANMETVWGGKIERDPNGNRPDANGYIDPTHPRSIAHILDRVRQAVRNGYTYLKLDFNNIGTGGWYEKKKTSFEIMREHYTRIREAAGKDTYILYCTPHPDRATVGLADATRTSMDVGCGVRAAINDVLRSYELNGRWMAVDNDCYYTSPEDYGVDGGQNLQRTWISMIGLSCGMAITSDLWNRDLYKPYLRNIEVLQPPAKERTEVLDLCTSSEWPRLAGVVKRPWGQWSVALLWNPKDTSQAVKLNFAEAGLDPAKTYAVWSFWDNKFLGLAKGSWTTPTLERWACQHLMLTPVDEKSAKPVLIGSNLHIYCGAAELKKVSSSKSGINIEFTDAGARDGDIFIYSAKPLAVSKAAGLTIKGIEPAGENVWVVHISDRQSGSIQSIGIKLLPQDAEAKLWYQQPATEWRTEALPIGNGRLGAMMFGGVENERIQFNEQTLWVGEGGTFEYPNIGPFGRYQSFGDVSIHFAGATDPVSEYRRELSLETGIHQTMYTQNQVHYKREAFASHPDQVLVFHYTADKKAAYTGELMLKLAHPATQEAIGNELTGHGILPNGLKFACRLKIVANGGKVTAKDDRLIFERCDELTVLLDARTNYKPEFLAGWRGGDPKPMLAGKSFQVLRRAHVTDFAPFMRRLTMTLGQTESSVRTLPTDRRLELYSHGGADPELETLKYQLGRYVLVSSSRPGGLPANLQGLWNDSNTPNWDCDWHTDINLEMNYWAAESANLSELHEPLFDFLEAQAVPARLYTRKRFGESTRGWTAYLTMNPFGGHGCEIFNGATAWLAQHYFDHWDYTRDREFLRTRAYPFLKEISEYWADRLKPLPNGKLVAPGGWSPEIGPHNTDGVMCDQQLIWQLFEDYLAAARELRLDEPFQVKVTDLQSRLSIHKIGRFGQLQEWQEDWDNPDEPHRHMSHLLCVYPGRQVNPTDTPELAKAAVISLNSRRQLGDGAQSWTWPWRAALRARLRETEAAYQMLRGLFQHNTMPNLLVFATPPDTMEVDGTLGYPAAVNEMLLQCHHRTPAGEPILELLPTLPKAWPTGRVTGLRARGGFTVDMEWVGGKLTNTRIFSLRGGTCVVQCGGRTQRLELKADQSLEWSPTP